MLLIVWFDVAKNFLRVVINCYHVHIHLLKAEATNPIQLTVVAQHFLKKCEAQQHVRPEHLLLQNLNLSSLSALEVGPLELVVSRHLSVVIFQ